MAVEDFLTVKDAKHTVEKVVRQKPSLAELTTIERPGKPVSADNLLEGEPKKEVKVRKKKIYKKVEPSEITRTGNYTLIITEKPQAAMKIADALGKAKKYTEDGVSFYEVEKDGKEIRVASAVGHLFGLDYKEGQKGWPIFEVEWRPAYEKKNSAFTRKYYSLLSKLAKRAGDIIVATDYDVEGEVIGWNVLRFICKRTTAKRMKYSTLTKNELVESYEKPMEELDWGQAYAGETRHILDWLYGINLSRALMSAIKTTGSFKILSIGRVQGPALKIIVDREIEIANFKPEPYWNVFATVDGFDYKHPKDIFDKKELDKFKDVKEGIAKTKDKEEKVEPGVPFDLTTLQREAYRVHRIGPSQTLQIAQKLYIDGLISYPRTSSQKIPETINPKNILKLLAKNFAFAGKAKRAKPVEGEKSDPAHPSIYPTGETGKMAELDEKLYTLIVKRFVAAFSDDAVTANRRVEIVAKNDDSINFTASGLKVLKKGWTEFYPYVMEEKDIPVLNGEVTIDKVYEVEKETTPPKRYSPTSLITILEKKNLGTKATRSTIVDTLFDRGYLDGKSIAATALGMKLIETLEKYSSIIIDENLTRQLEDELEMLLAGKNPLELQAMEDKVVAKAEKIIEDISKEFKVHEREIGKGILSGIVSGREAEKEANTLRVCPTCEKGDLRITYSPRFKRQFIACSAYPNCKQTYSLPPGYIKRADKDCEDCGYPKVISLKKGKRPWEFCFNPQCESNRKRIEEWEKKKAAGLIGKGSSPNDGSEAEDDKSSEKDSEEGNEEE